MPKKWAVNLWIRKAPVTRKESSKKLNTQKMTILSYAANVFWDPAASTAIAMTLPVATAEARTM